MDLLHRFISHMEGLDPGIQQQPLLLAVSGGLDSVVLAALCRGAGYPFQMAHCNFQLRGTESLRDEDFVRQLGEQYGVPTFIRRFDTMAYANRQQCSVQEAARELRYQWFHELVKGPDPATPDPFDFNALPLARHTGPLLLTAHHADDNIETLLMHFFRGTGLNGLTAIPGKTGYIRRPLLPFFREELDNFARAKNLQWVEDSSNESVKYTRNYFRHELIPALEKVYPQVRHNLQDNIRRFRETAELYQYTVDQLLKKLVKQVGGEWQVPVKQLLGFGNRALVFALIVRFGFREQQVDELLRLGKSQSGHFIDAPDAPYRIIRHRHWFIISRVRPAESLSIIIQENEPEVRFPGGILRLDILRAPADISREDQQYLDLSGLRFPLLLRRWKAGDYFYPLGMRKKKKIARFLTDLRLSKPEKENSWVIESGEHIVCVAGKRIDDRHRVTDHTRSILRISLEKA